MKTGWNDTHNTGGQQAFRGYWNLEILTIYGSV